MSWWCIWVSGIVWQTERLGSHPVFLETWALETPESELLVKFFWRDSRAGSWRLEPIQFCLPYNFLQHFFISHPFIMPFFSLASILLKCPCPCFRIFITLRGGGWMCLFFRFSFLSMVVSSLISKAQRALGRCPTCRTLPFWFRCVLVTHADQSLLHV